MAAVFLRPGHADPAALADAAAEARRVGVVALLRPLRREGAGGDLIGKEGAHLAPQFDAFRRQADRLEGQGGGHDGRCSVLRARLIARRPAARVRRRPRPRRATELRGPVALAAEIVAPRQRAQGVAVQDVLAGEADGAMHLVGNGSAGLGGLAAADFCGRGLEEQCVAGNAAVGQRFGGEARRRHRRGNLAGEPRQRVLDGLKFCQFLFERDPLVGVAHGDVERGLQRPGDLQAARGGAHQHQRGRIESRGCGRLGERLDAIEGDAIAGVARQRLARGDLAGARCHPRDHRRAGRGGREHDDLGDVGGERHVAHAPAQAAFSVEGDAALRLRRGERHRLGGRGEAGLLQQPAGEHGLRQRQRQRGASRRLQHRKAGGEVGAGSAMGLRDPRQRQAGFRQRLP